jgi:hypothetical protein
MLTWSLPGFDNALVLAIFGAIAVFPKVTFGFTNNNDIIGIPRSSLMPRKYANLSASATLTLAGSPLRFDCRNSETKLFSRTTRAIPEDGWASEDQIKKHASSFGINLSFSTLGPGYRAVARSSHDESLILGYCEGFIRPSGNIIHVDKLEVWKKALDRAKKENPDGFIKNGGQEFGVSLLLGYLCLLHAREKGCTVAEFLAIDDEGFQHKRLVRFFKRAGFQTIKYVGDDLASVPDRLVWGGCGTLMNQKIDLLLERWTKIISIRS